MKTEHDILKKLSNKIMLLDLLKIEQQNITDPVLRVAAKIEIESQEKQIGILKWVLNDSAAFR